MPAPQQTSSRTLAGVRPHCDRSRVHRRSAAAVLTCRVQGAGCRVQGAGCRVQEVGGTVGLGFGVGVGGWG